MSEETKYHLMYLNPVQKAALKLIILNYVTLRIKGTVDDVSEGESTSHEGTNQILDDLDYYEALTAKLPHVHYISEAKGEVLMFVPKAFMFVKQSLTAYDYKHSMLTDSQNSLITAEYGKIEKLATESSNYQYTKTEIKGLK